MGNTDSAGAGAKPAKATVVRASASADEKATAVKRGKSADNAAPPDGPAADERECSRQLNCLWTTAHIGLSVSVLNDMVAAFANAPKPVASVVCLLPLRVDGSPARQTCGGLRGIRCAALRCPSRRPIRLYGVACRAGTPLVNCWLDPSARSCGGAAPLRGPGRLSTT
jgi:hypothetical protein